MEFASERRRSGRGWRTIKRVTFMSRYKKDRKVGEIEHRSGVKVDLMFDPNDDKSRNTSLMFSATVGDDEFTAKSAEEVRAAVTKFLDSQASLEWIPIIEVRPVEPFNAGGMSFVGLGIDRYYIANTSDPNVIRQLSWDRYDVDPYSLATLSNYSTEMNRILRSNEYGHWHGDIKTKLPYHDERHGYSHRAYYYLPYDEGTWAALQEIVQGIDRLQDWLNELLGTDKGRAKLTEVGAKMAKLLLNGK